MFLTLCPMPMLAFSCNTVAKCGRTELQTVDFCLHKALTFHNPECRKSTLLQNGVCKTGAVSGRETFN